MKCHRDNGKLHLVLSRRNLLSLLAKLDISWSARTISCAIEGSNDPIYVTSEEDAEHYGTRIPGEMHPETEAKLVEQKTEA